MHPTTCISNDTYRYTHGSILDHRFTHPIPCTGGDSSGGRKTRYAGGPYGEKSCAGCDDNTEKRGRTHAPPPPRLDAQRFKRAEREQEIHSLLLFRLDIAIDGEERGKVGKRWQGNDDGERIRDGVERINIS